MNRWWIVGAGAVGIGIAVLMIPKADTGGDIPVLELETQTQTAHGERVDEGAMARDPNAPVKKKVRPPTKEERAAGLARADDEPNPIARLPHLNITPEVKTASGLQAPWTETRRQLSKAGGADAAELTGKINQLNGLMATYRRSPAVVEWSQLEADQRALIADVRSSRFHNGEIEASLKLVEERMGMIDKHRADEAAAAP